MVVQTTLTNRDRARFQKGAQPGDVTLDVKRRRIVRMDARSRENETRIFRGVVSRHRCGID
jgi:hypothetical protein